MASDEYPRGPDHVPDGLRAPSRAYRLRAWLSALGVVVFFAAYVGLTVWFGWTGVRLTLASIANDHDGAGWIVGVVAIAIAVFLAMSVILMPRTRAPRDLVELTEAEQPRLFAFLRRVAADVGAPFPERVFVDPSVNAAVVAEISIANLLFPPRKHLLIGLGLTNLLTRGELKALLAHELGHFGQQVTWLGRWTIVGQTIARRVIVRHDWVDQMLASIFGYHIALIAVSVVGMALVWSIRAVVETLFGWMFRLERAFDRELELQADLAAVAVCGSDAMVHVLHRSDVAVSAFEAAVGFATAEAEAARPVADLFAIQRRVVVHRRRILSEPWYGAAPPLPADPATHRLFVPAMALPPQTWRSHPHDHEREENAKRRYVAAPLDDRDPWLLFDEPARLCAAVTARALERAAGATVVPIAESLARLDAQAERVHLSARYRGAYLDRAITRDAATVAALYGPEPAPDALDATLASLYPASLEALQAREQHLAREVALLDGLARGVLEAPGRVIRYRGEARRRQDVPALVAAAQRELDELRGEIGAERGRTRAAHRVAARHAGAGWEAHLQSLLALVHYAEHNQADLACALDSLDRAVVQAMLTQRFGEVDVYPYYQAGHNLADALAGVQGKAREVVIPPGVTARLSRTPWRDAFAAPIWAPPVWGQGDFGAWSDAAHGWATSAVTALGDLRDAALDELLALEARCAAAAGATVVAAAQTAPAPALAAVAIDAAPAATLDPDAAPAPAAVPASYPTLSRAIERREVTRLDFWTRFRFAEGGGAAALRFVVAAMVIGGVAFAAIAMGGADVTIYNGLDRDVVVTIDGETVTVAAHRPRRVAVGSGRFEIHARTETGETIDRLTVGTEERAHYVYNVAAATPLLAYTAYYRSAGEDAREPTTRIVAPVRWQRSRADHHFEKPPEQVSSRGGGDTREVLDEPGTTDPLRLLPAVSPEAAAEMIAAHTRWDDPSARFFAIWWFAGAEHGGVAAPLAARLAETPDDLSLRSIELALAGERWAEVCAAQRARAAAQPEHPGWQALVTSCLDDGAARRAARRAGYARWPDDPWQQLTAGYLAASLGEYRDADQRLTRACRALPGECDTMVLDVVRVRRAAAPGTDVDLRDLALDQAMVALHLTPPPESWSAALARGELDVAVARAEQAGQLVPALWLAAASDGAAPELVARALARTDADVDPDTALLAYALRRRAGTARDTALREAAVAATTHHRGHADAARADAVVALFTLLVQDGPLPRAAAEAAFAELDLRTGTAAYAAAVVLLGDRCPPAWRDLAKALGFAIERPYFR